MCQHPAVTTAVRAGHGPNACWCQSGELGGDTDTGGGGTGLDGSLAKEMSPSTILQGNRVLPKSPGRKKQRVLSHSPLGHTETTSGPSDPTAIMGLLSTQRGENAPFPQAGCWVPNQALWL